MHLTGRAVWLGAIKYDRQDGKIAMTNEGLHYVGVKCIKSYSCHIY